MSGRFELNKEDYKKWGKNALIFAAPALLVLISSFTQVVPGDWKYGALVLYLLNLIADIIRKYVAGK